MMRSALMVLSVIWALCWFILVLALFADAISDSPGLAGILIGSTAPDGALAPLILGTLLLSPLLILWLWKRKLAKD